MPIDFSYVHVNCSSISPFFGVWHTLANPHSYSLKKIVLIQFPKPFNFKIEVSCKVGKFGQSAKYGQ